MKAFTEIALLVSIAVVTLLWKPAKKWFTAYFMPKKQRYMMYQWMYNFIQLGSNDVGFCWALTKFQNKHRFCGRYELRDLKELMDYEPQHPENAYWFPKTEEGKKIRLAILANILHQTK